MQTKKCSMCANDKPLYDYYKQVSSHDGKRSMCKPCSKEYYRKYREDKGLTGKAVGKSNAEIIDALKSCRPPVTTHTNQVG